MASCVPGPAFGQMCVLQKPTFALFSWKGSFGTGSSSSIRKTSDNTSRSATDRVKKPHVSSVTHHWARPSLDIAPHVGLRVITLSATHFRSHLHITYLKPWHPLNEAGLMIDPPVCVPKATGTWKSPTAAPDPEEEPPGVRPGSWALELRFWCQLPCLLVANSVVEVLPKIRAPAARSAITEFASTPLGSSLSNSLELYWVGKSSVRITSLTPIGRPCKGPLWSTGSSSRALAFWRLRLGLKYTHALTVGSRFWIRSRSDLAYVSTLSSPLWRSGRASAAVSCHGSLDPGMVM